MTNFFLSISILFTIFHAPALYSQDTFHPDSIFFKESHELGGYMMPMYEHGVDANEFKFKYLRITGKGSIHKHLGYFIQIDAAKELTLKDAFIDIRLSHYFNIRAGQMPYHLGVNEVPWEHPTIFRPQIRRLMLGDPRDFGIQFNGSFKNLDYYTYIVNGTERGVSEDDKKKTLLFSLDYHIGSNLKVGLSQYLGSRDFEFENDSVAGAKRNRSAAYFWYQGEKLMLRGEYMGGMEHTYNQSGYYFIGGYFITNKLQSVFRYDYFESEMKDVSSRILAPGLNVFFNDKFYVRSIFEFSESHQSLEYERFVLELGMKFL